jgi:hypothetical protein
MGFLKAQMRFAMKVCVDTRPGRQSPEAEHRPKHVPDRIKMLREHGKKAFLLPDGTVRRPGVPAYPVVSAKTGCYHCGMMRMAYTRIGAAISSARTRTEKNQLIKARQRLISLGLQFANVRDKANRCNFAYRASKRYPRR